MKSTGVAVFLLALVAWVGCKDRSLARMFKSDGNMLRGARNDWISLGSPTNFDLAEVLGPPSAFFVYTNIVRGTNGVFRCRFCARRPGWPPGVLAITDDGQLIFVCSTNGKVTISPDENGFEP